ncbi:hypothetical protein MRX96_046899 [Rhipicephalus microplus]
MLRELSPDCHEKVANADVSTAADEEIDGVSGDIARVSTSFDHPCDSSEVIQVMIDPPYIFKCIRNNLLKAGKFLLPGDKEVQHFHFEALLDYEEQQAGLRAVPKSTKAHIRPNAFRKLSAKLAVQASLL